jgi:hypothetical protein
MHNLPHHLSVASLRFSPPSPRRMTLGVWWMVQRPTCYRWPQIRGPSGAYFSRWLVVDDDVVLFLWILKSILLRDSKSNGSRLS